MHVGAIQIYEAGPLRRRDGGIDVATFKRGIESVMHLLPRYRQRLHAIPWPALRIDDENHCLVLEPERSTFLGAPGFDKEHWPRTPDAAWHHALHRHYGCRPYWE